VSSKSRSAICSAIRRHTSQVAGEKSLPKVRPQGT
jgi:hypothetical protein